MIRSPLRAGIALACALSLSACGGGDGDVYVGGTVTGNTKAGLVLTNNDGPRLEIAAGLEIVNGSDRKAVAPGDTEVQMTRIPEGAVYGVTVLAAPGQTCAVANGSGTMDNVGKTVDLNCTTP